jgi:hypothetical protein
MKFCMEIDNKHIDKFSLIYYFKSTFKNIVMVQNLEFLCDKFNTDIICT